jgi:hypothetical protein
MSEMGAPPLEGAMPEPVPGSELAPPVVVVVALPEPEGRVPVVV